jgi:hypothetical protein
MDPTPELQQLVGQLGVQIAYLRAELRLQAEILEAMHEAASGTAEQREAFWASIAEKLKR